MKRFIDVCNISSLALTLTLTLTLALASALAQSPAQADLNSSSLNAVRNPSFEQTDAAGFAQDWQFRPGVTSLDRAASDGERSLRIHANEPISSFSRQTLELTPNTRYIVRARLKTEDVSGSGAGFRLILDDTRVESERLRGNHDWRVLEESFTTPEVLENAFLDLIWDVSSGTLWFDDLELIVDDGTFVRSQASLTRASFDVPNMPIRRPNQVPIGVFQSGAELGGLAGFEMMVTRLQAAGMDSAIVIERSQSQALFDSAAEAGFNLILLPNFELDRSWWADEFPTTLEQARAAASAIIDNVREHSSLLAYALVDEPSNRLAEKVCTLSDAFRELDADTPITGVFVGLNRGELIFRDCQPDILLIDLYPFKEASPIGDFAMRGFDYNNLDYVDYIRRYTRFKTPEQPLWVLLQTHKTDWPDYKLREPIPAELRAMNWLAVGEGASGFFYFHWSSAQTWRGLADNPELLAEVGNFSKRVRALEPLLLAWHKTDDAFFIADTARADDSDQFGYTSTLSTAHIIPPEGELSAQAAREDMYVLVVNRDVTSTRTFRLELLPTLGAAANVELLNAETGALQTLADPITLAPGDAALFQVFLAGLEQAIARHTPEINPEVDVEADVEADVDTDVEVNVPDSETDVEADSEADVDTDVEANSDTDVETNVSDVEIDVETDSETIDETNVEDVAETDVAETDAVTDTSLSETEEILLTEAVVDSIDSDIVSTVRETTTTAATLVELPADGRRAKTIENGSVPYYPIDWNQPVDAWWDGHPLNPANGGFDPNDVVHPQPRVNVCDYQQGSQTGGILEALNALPTAGGTLWLPAACGPYVISTPLEWLQDRYSHQGQINILRRSNLHFLSDGARIVSRPSIAPHDEERTIFNFKSMEMQDGRREGDPERNLYFENLVFDGGGQLHQAISVDGVRDVFIYNVTFGNFLFAPRRHPGIIRAAIQSDNVWCIRCTFDDRASFAIYIDGVHNGGVVDSTFTGGYRNAILMLTNDDTAPFSDRQRNVQYYVVANNRFVFEGGGIIQMAAANTLITDNLVRGTHRHFVGSDGKWSRVLGSGLIYDFDGNVIRNNTLEGNLEFFLEVSGWNEGDYRRYNIGNFTVTGNSANNVRTILNLRPRFDDGLIDGIRLQDNRFAGVREQQRDDGEGNIRNVDFIDNIIEYNE